MGEKVFGWMVEEAFGLGGWGRFLIRVVGEGMLVGGWVLVDVVGVGCLEWGKLCVCRLIDGGGWCGSSFGIIG